MNFSQYNHIKELNTSQQHHSKISVSGNNDTGATSTHNKNNNGGINFEKRYSGKPENLNDKRQEGGISGSITASAIDRTFNLGPTSSSQIGKKGY